jgi:hypothetical protein
MFLAEVEARVEEERPNEAVRESAARSNLDGELSNESPSAPGDEHLSGMSLHDGQAINRVLIVNRVVDPPLCGAGRLQLGRLLIAALKDARHLRRRDVNEWTIGILEIDLEEPNAIASSIRHDRDISAWRLGTAPKADVVGDVHVVVTTECLTAHAVSARYAGTRIEARRRRRVGGQNLRSG